MPDTAHSSMLSRVRAALGRANATAPRPPENEALVRRVETSANTPALFLDRANTVGMNAVAIPRDRLACEVITTLLAARARNIALEADQSFDELLAMLEPALRDANFSIHAPRNAETFAPLYALDAGITFCPAAIAESGSLVVTSSSTTGRGVSLVPPIHVAIVRARDVLPDLVDLWPFLAARDIPTLSSSFTLITGPSKTADIEGVLVTGVHGPREVHVFVMSDERGK